MYGEVIREVGEKGAPTKEWCLKNLPLYLKYLENSPEMKLESGKVRKSLDLRLIWRQFSTILTHLYSVEEYVLIEEMEELPKAEQEKKRKEEEREWKERDYLKLEKEQRRMEKKRLEDEKTRRTPITGQNRRRPCNDLIVEVKMELKSEEDTLCGSCSVSIILFRHVTETAKKKDKEKNMHPMKDGKEGN